VTAGSGLVVVIRYGRRACNRCFVLLVIQMNRQSSVSANMNPSVGLDLHGNRDETDWLGKASRRALSSAFTKHHLADAV